MIPIKVGMQWILKREFGERTGEDVFRLIYHTDLSFSEKVNQLDIFEDERNETEREILDRRSEGKARSLGAIAQWDYERTQGSKRESSGTAKAEGVLEVD